MNRPSYSLFPSFALLVVLLATAPPTLAINWTEHVVTSTYHHDPAWIEIADMDGDDDMDLLTGATFFGSGALAWWENNGSQAFTEHSISGTGNFWRAIPIDIDLDDDVDVFAFRGSEGPPYRLTLYLNDGAQSFTEVDVMVNTINYALASEPVDLDGDDDLDILTGRAPNVLAWLENTGGLNFVEHTIDNTNPNSLYINTAADFDLDGDVDIVNVYNAGSANRIFWWENDGNENFTKHPVFDFPAPPFNVGGIVVVDLDEDGDTDIATNTDIWPSYGRVSWLENQGGGGFVEHVLDEDHNSSAIFAVDLDDDDDLDLVAGQYWFPGSIKWYENDGNESFTTRLIRTDFPGARATVGDLDGDGALDIAANAFFGRDIAWWESDVQVTADADQDGIADDVDLCLETTIPESVPTHHLGVNRWALVDGDGTFDTTLPPGGGGGPDFEFTVEDTRGCSCEQIIEAWGLGLGHTKFGCSSGVILQWIADVWNYEMAEPEIESQVGTGGLKTLDGGGADPIARGTPNAGARRPALRPHRIAPRRERPIE